MATIYPEPDRQPDYPQARYADSSRSGGENQQDPLFEALVKYITGGGGATSINADEVQNIINQNANAPGGRAYLESLTDDYSSHHEAWNRLTPVQGQIKLDMTTAQINLRIPEISKTLDASLRLFARPYDGALSGTLYYNDASDFSSNNFEVKLTANSFQLNIDISVDGRPIGYFKSDAIGFALPPFPVRGEATIR